MEKRLLEHTAGDLCNGSTESFGQSDERNPFCPRRRKPNSPPEKSPDKDGESRCPYCCSPNAAWIPISTASPRNRKSIGQTGPNGFCCPRHPQNLGRETAGYLSWRAEWGSANAIELEDEVEGIGSLGGGRIREGREGGQAG